MIEIPSKRTLSWDVIAVLGYAAAVVPLQWIVLPSPIRIVLLTPMLLFLPGFTLSTVLFPGRPAEDGSIVKTEVSRLGLIERVALSVGLSAGLLPLLAFGFDLVLGRVAGPIVVVTAVFSAVMALLGGVRRSRLLERDRFEIPIVRWFDGMAMAVEDDSTRTAVVNVVLAGSVVLAVGAVGIGFAVPQNGATFTDFAVGTEEGGEFVTDGYPEGLAVGESTETAVLIENNEGESTEYHVVARFERVQDGTVTDIQDADGFSVAVESGETVVESYGVTRSMTGDDVRLRFLLYRDEPPTEPQPETAYRTVHVWVDGE
ncbi:Uncharacterized membrane protein [Halorubrum aquaticum]|uniref:Uncharacterized membrane protein n=1 Tax=Halorubrum aquaticum TaxID=387340 RepID=A0A1I2ZP99_9EURY|nr:DUF1616 domain-containing protein [Halorubrum aquaticum]SFH38911.1 Uncharacterized membrane protein [Halorubrum aquaticum]